MMKLSRWFIFGISGLSLLAVIGLGCGDSGDQLTMDVMGSVVVRDAAVAPVKFQAAGEEQQVLIGVSVVEVTDNFFDAIGIDFRGLSATAAFPDFDIQIELTPKMSDIDTTSNTGLLFKRENGVPLGQSSVDLLLTALLPDGNSVELGTLSGSADPTDANRIPLLGNIPVLSFLFNGQEKEAEITELLIFITPEIVDVLDE